jgi:ribonuclease HI
MTKIFLVCDGGKKNGFIYGSFKIFDENREKLDHEQFYLGDGTSNEAEYKTLLNGLRYIHDNYNPKKVVVIMDSKLVVMQSQNLWNCNYEHLDILRKEVQKYNKYFIIEFQHVKRDKIVKMLGH